MEKNISVFRLLFPTQVKRAEEFLDRTRGTIFVHVHINNVFSLSFKLRQSLMIVLEGKDLRGGLVQYCHEERLTKRYREDISREESRELSARVAAFLKTLRSKTDRKIIIIKKEES